MYKRITFSDVNTGVDSQTGYGNVLVTNATEIIDNGTTYSFIDENNTFVFGLMYYVNDNNSYGWLGGALETFTPSSNGASMIMRHGTTSLKNINKINNPVKSVTAGHAKNFIAAPVDANTLKLK